MKKCAPRVKDLTDLRFGELHVLQYEETREKRAFWRCVCSCGKTVIVEGRNLNRGGTRSCGHAPLPRPGVERSASEARVDTKEYRTWTAIKNRCRNQLSKDYVYYGARGIQVCDRWMQSYESFLEDMGRAPSAAHSIDRIDNDGDYTPANCRWADKFTQLYNRRNSVILNFRGKRLPIKDAIALSGSAISPSLVHARRRLGWSDDAAVVTPILKRPGA